MADLLVTGGAGRPPAGTVDVVTVNWNAGKQLEECVESVRAHDSDIVGRFIVVDNGSADGSADFASDWDKLHIDKAAANLGFGRACNRGAHQGEAPYILFLNPDTRLTEPAISKAAAFLESKEGVGYGICGIKLVDDRGEATRHCARFPRLRNLASFILGLDRLLPRMAPSLLLKDFDHLSSRPVDHVQGAFYLIRREAFEAVGGFDEDYFVYLEDLDLSLRVREQGLRSYYLAEAKAYHRGGGTSTQVRGIARFYAIEARILYGRKHLGRLANALHIAMICIVEPPATLAWHLYKNRGKGLGSVADAFRLLFRNSPGVLRGTTARKRGEEAAAKAR